MQASQVKLTYATCDVDKTVCGFVIGLGEKLAFHEDKLEMVEYTAG